jgi:4-hydroxy-tetrahydrodipicolinate synthase
MTTHPAALSGIIGATLTPFAADGTVDAKAMDAQLDMMVGHCDAISIHGAEASEYQMLTPWQRRASLRRAIEAVDGRVAVIAGASSPAVREVLELSALAADAGAQYVQVLMPLRPWGGPPTEADLLAYFERVARDSPLPVVCYHNPARGADPAATTMVRLSEIDGVVAFKESSRDISKIGRLIQDIHVSGNAAYFTTMQPLLTTLQLGGAGAMMPPPATLIGQEVCRAHAAGDAEAAVRWQMRFSLFPARWASYGLAPVMKVAMAHLGVDLGEPAEPFAAMRPADAEALKLFLDNMRVAQLMSR